MFQKGNLSGFDFNVSISGDMRFGDNSASDLADNETGTSDDNPEHRVRHKYEDTEQNKIPRTGTCPVETTLRSLDGYSQ